MTIEPGSLGGADDLAREPKRLLITSPMRIDLTSGLPDNFRRPLQIASVGLVLFLGLTSLLAPPKPTAVGIDQLVYASTLEQMRFGDDYYTAMTQALTEVYGPPVAVRDFRFPTLFWLLHVLPPEALWVAFVWMAVLAGTVAALGSPGGFVGPLVSAYLLLIGRARTPFGVTDQFLTVELWVAPLALAAVILLFARKPALATPFALGAFAIREHAGLLLVAVLIDAWLRGRRVVAILGTFAAGLLVTAHVVATSSHIVPGGTHTPLDAGHEPLASFIQTVGFGFSPQWLGFCVWLLAWVFVIRTRHIRTVGPYLGLPLVALFINRPYWGILTVPVALLLAISAISVVLTSVARHSSSHPLFRLRL